MSKSLQALFEGGRLIEISERDAAGTLPPGWTAKPLRASLRPYIGSDWSPHAKEGLGAVTEEALERFRTQLQARLAARRWEVQTQGIEREGKRWPTDADSRAAMAESLALAFEWEKAHPGKTWQTAWKNPDGFITVTRTELLAIAFAMSEHIQNAFQREAKFLQQIREAGFETLAPLSEEIELPWSAPERGTN